MSPYKMATMCNNVHRHKIFKVIIICIRFVCFMEEKKGNRQKVGSCTHKNQLHKHI